LALLLHRRRSPEANQTLDDVCPSPGLVHYIYIFEGPCPQQNFARCKIHFASKSCVLLYWQRYCTALQQRGISQTLQEVGGGVEPWLMARWKARVEFLLKVSELLFLSLAVEALQGKLVKTRCLQEGVGQFELRLQGEAVFPLPIY